MKTVKVPDLSRVAINVPFVRFSKEESNGKKYFLVEFLVNLPLGAKISKPVQTQDASKKRIVLNFELTAAKGRITDSYELVHYPSMKIENVFDSDDALLALSFSAKRTAISTENPSGAGLLLRSAAKKDPEYDAEARYMDAPRK